MDFISLVVWSLLAFSLCNTRGNPGVYSGFFKGGGEGHIVSNRGYSADCHVDLYAVFYLMHVT